MKIYCSGIGGIGLSAYAALQHAQGHTVLGSDRASSSLIDQLRTSGIQVSLQQDGSFLSEDIELFVYSEAIPEDSPERVKAKELGIKQVSYFQALGDYLRERSLTVIAVCGTHGKSTTTAMLAKIAVDAGKDPTVVVGTKVPDLGGVNWRKGESTLAIVEACEYRGSFLHLSPDVVVMTNVDGDHFDAFNNLDAYKKIFADFFSKLPDNGVVVTHGHDPDAMALATASGKSVMTTDELPVLSPSLSAKHMRSNAGLAVKAAELLSIDSSMATTSVQTFSGTWRRMEHKGHTAEGALVIDDYAHHPVEIAATISGVREMFPGKTLVCVFQPHLWSRTKELYAEFVKSFAGATIVLLTDVYKARNEDEGGVSMEQFAEEIASESTVECIYTGSLEQTERSIPTYATQDTILLVMGAGSIGDLAEKVTV